MGRYFETVQISISDSYLQNLFLWCLPISIMSSTFLIGIIPFPHLLIDSIIYLTVGIWIFILLWRIYSFNVIIFKTSSLLTCFFLTVFQWQISLSPCIWLCVGDHLLQGSEVEKACLAKRTYLGYRRSKLPEKEK